MTQSVKTGYVYRYKNGYVVTDYHLKEMVRGKTIDTFYQPNIKIKRNEKGKIRKFTTIVNNKVAAYNNLLFINSPLKRSI